MFKKVWFLCLIFFTIISVTANAQLNIPEYDQLYRVRLWRKVDLREKQNKGFYAIEREVTKFILDGINSGELKLYSDQNLTLEEEDVSGLMTRKGAAETNPFDNAVSYENGEMVSYEGKYYRFISPNSTYGVLPTDIFYWGEVDVEETKGQLWSARDIAELEIIEDAIFDKVRSRLFYDIEAIRLKIPGDVRYSYDPNAGENALALPLGYVDYDEVEALFRSREDAKWVNRYNPKEWKNFADAFLLRLFTGPIVKYENPDDEYISNMFRSHFEAVMEMSRYEMYLMEREHNLWEY